MRRQHISGGVIVTDMTALTRDACAALDAADPLAPLRGRFDLDAADARGEIYLDGNSLGPLPRATAERVRQVLHDEWGRDLIRSWNTAGWITLSQRIGDKIARLVGAGPGLGQGAGSLIGAGIERGQARLQAFAQSHDLVGILGCAGLDDQHAGSPRQLPSQVLEGLGRQLAEHVTHQP